MSMGEGVAGNPARLRPTDVEVETVGAALARNTGGRKDVACVLRELFLSFASLDMPFFFHLERERSGRVFGA